MNETLIGNNELKLGVLKLALNFSWFEIIGKIWEIGRKIIRGFASEGIYEVLDYECTLELLNKEGTKAKIHKREKVKYLQNYVNSYQDRAWGNGAFLLKYKCSPGIVVDQYQLGHNTYNLISLRSFRNKGDIDEFNIEWHMLDGFLKPTGFWGTAINHRTKNIRVKIIFPIDRPPLRASIFEKNLQRTQLLTSETRQRLPDGRTVIIWEKDNPRLYEDYVLSWDW